MMTTIETIRVGLLALARWGSRWRRFCARTRIARAADAHFQPPCGGKRVDWVPSSVKWTDQIDDVLRSDVDVVVELVGGLHPAHEWVRAALTNGKSVVTANKQLIAHYGTELGSWRARAANSSASRPLLPAESPSCERFRKVWRAIGWSRCAAS